MKKTKQSVEKEKETKVSRFQIDEICMAKAKKLYQEKFPERIEKRLKKELEYIHTAQAENDYLVAREIALLARKNETPVTYRNTFGGSLTAFMADISYINPLPPHYYCPKCKQVLFTETEKEVVCGIDLPDIKCPACGADMRKDGYDIPVEMTFGIRGGKRPVLEMDCSASFYEECLKKHYSEIEEKTEGVMPRVLNEEQEKFLEYHMLWGAGMPGKELCAHRFLIEKNQETVPVLCVVNPNLDFLNALEATSHIQARKTFFGDKKTFLTFKDMASIGLQQSSAHFKFGTLGVPIYGEDTAQEFLSLVKPTCYSELIHMVGMIIGIGTWNHNAKELMIEDKIAFMDTISSRADIVAKLERHGITRERASVIAQSVATGHGLFEDMEREMEAAKVEDWYIESCKKIKYLFPRAHIIFHNAVAWQIAWYKKYYPDLFYQCFFDTFATKEQKQDLIREKNKITERLDEMDPVTARELGKNRVVEYPLFRVAVEMYQRGFSIHE